MPDRIELRSMFGYRYGYWFKGAIGTIDARVEVK
jgi:hypothetical protein